MLLDLLDDPVLLLEEVHLIEVHIRSFLSLAEVVSQYLSIPHHFCVIEDVIHFIQEDLMLDLLVEEVPHRVFDLPQLKAAFKFALDLLAKLLLHTFPDIKGIDLLEE